ncbi:MAG: deoxyribonuclease V [Candidatus Omnitrophica bacterium]|nr:deoxyribonuclease V [Candidatus Omnitrophota bacterium]
MEYKKIHPWDVDITEAIRIQEQLKKMVVLENKSLNPRKIAAVDVGYFKDSAKAVVCIFSYPTLSLIEIKNAYKKISFPYIPSFLSFREGPVILEAFKKVKNIPDLILFDGQGILHPRRLGIATHMGIILDLPTIGCAKSLLFGKFNPVAYKRGNFSYIYDEATREILGIALCSRSKVKPIFISPGYKIDLKKSKEIVFNLTSRYRIPEPLRFAHKLTKDGTV